MSGSFRTFLKCNFPFGWSSTENRSPEEVTTVKGESPGETSLWWLPVRSKQEEWGNIIRTDSHWYFVVLVQSDLLPSPCFCSSLPVLSGWGQHWRSRRNLLTSPAPGSSHCSAVRGEGGGREKSERYREKIKEGGREEWDTKGECCSSLLHLIHTHTHSGSWGSETRSQNSSITELHHSTPSHHSLLLLLSLCSSPQTQTHKDIQYTCCGEAPKAGLLSFPSQPPPSFWAFLTPPSLSLSLFLTLSLSSFFYPACSGCMVYYCNTAQDSQQEACRGRALTDLSPLTSIWSRELRRRGSMDQVGKKWQWGWRKRGRKERWVGGCLWRWMLGWEKTNNFGGPGVGGSVSFSGVYCCRTVYCWMMSLLSEEKTVI